MSVTITVYEGESTERELGSYESVTVSVGSYSGTSPAMLRDEDGREIAELRPDGWRLPDGTLWSDIVIA